MSRTGYVVGITLFVNADGSLGLFENGLRQNVLFLKQMFDAAPSCARCYLLNHGDSLTVTDAEAFGIDPADIVRTEDVADQLDFAIFAGAAMDAPTARRLRDRGCKLICYKGGNGAIISMEAIVARPARGDAERYFDADLYDAVWVTPQHWRTYRGWCETVYRAPVLQAPQVWSPWLIEHPRSRVKGRFAYVPTREAWRVGVLDPNITVMKTSHLPMLVCEAVYRQAPDALKAVYVTNGWPYRENEHFASFCHALSAVREGVMTLEPRFVGVEFMADHCDAIVTHQWENGLNYLYYEALYGGYPLIHNAPMIDPCGYRFEDFDPEDGARALILARARHDDDLFAYRERASEYLARVDPIADATRRWHEDALSDLR